MNTERTQQHLYELNTESRLTKLESNHELILTTLIEINHKFDKVEAGINAKIDKVETTINAKIDKVEAGINAKMDEGFNRINNRIWYNFYWMIGGFGVILTIIAHGFKWF